MDTQFLNSNYSLDNNSKIFRFDFSSDGLNLTGDIVEKGMGYGYGEAPEHVSDTINEVLKSIGEYIDIKCGFRILPYNQIEIDKESIKFESVKFNTGRIITGRLRKSISLALFACTAGDKISNFAKKIFEEGDYLRGYVIDAVGSEIVELAADSLEIKLAETAAHDNMKITSRYSPGYCNWHVEAQHDLFSLLPANFCGIKLTASSLMLPVKSVSGIIGIGPDVKKENYDCNICDMENCFRRK